MGERNLRGQFEPTPAIVRDVDPDIDGDTYFPATRNFPKGQKATEKIISQRKTTVTHQRGFGDSGYRIQTVEHECPACGFDRMVRRVDVSPERSNEVRYWCLNPNCVHFVRDNLSHATAGNYPQRDTDEPAVFEEVDA